MPTTDHPGDLGTLEYDSTGPLQYVLLQTLPLNQTELPRMKLESEEFTKTDANDEVKVRVPFNSFINAAEGRPQRIQNSVEPCRPHDYVRSLFGGRVRNLLTFTALGLITSSTSFAVTTVTGHHDDNANGDGYDTSSGSYDVPGTAGTTFNSNSGGSGFDAFDSTSSVTIEGGEFDLNGLNGFYDEATSSSISGGDFSGNSGYGVESSSVLSVTGGTFQNNGFDGLAVYGTVTLEGGVFGGNSRADLSTAESGTLKIYGYFAGLSNGQTRTLPKGSIESFVGTLEDQSAAETFYYLNEGSITLYDVPEPTSLVAMPAFAMALLARRVRRPARRPTART
jgi:hypothetical protein